MNRSICITFIAAAALLSGCDPQLPKDKAAGDDNVSGFAASLSDAEYSSLTSEQQYQVANKLLGTMYRGIAVSDFFDLENSNGMRSLTLKKGNNFLQNTRTALKTPLADDVRQQQDVIIDGDPDTGAVARFIFSTRQKELPLARIYQFPLSKDFFDHWVAYHLANTILFSPGEEIDSVDVWDVQNVYNALVKDFSNNRSIRQIISRHQRTEENWRRFRSPEDNTREMIELYLGLFDRDEDVPRAAIACKDLYLTNEANGYQLVSTGSPNTRPQLVLGSYVTTCDDFYDLIAGHPLVIPRVTTVLVEYFLAGRSNEDRIQLVESIVNSHPETFQQIFMGILFSKEYLLNTERSKSFEENFLGISHQLNWDPRSDIFRGMASGSGASLTDMREMNWPTMTLKLGRLFGIPMDSYSFANYHKGFREVLLIDNSRWQKGLGLYNPTLVTNPTDEQRRQYELDLAQYNKTVTGLTFDDFMDYLFLSVALRRASDTEKADLRTYISANFNWYLRQNADGSVTINNNYHDDIARIVFDYLSRLPELYYFKTIG